ncbi:hypothetical protein LINGRAHAP2_LOCUS20362 [Linum grandiflorum]
MTIPLYKTPAHSFRLFRFYNSLFVRRIHSLNKFDSPTIIELIGMDDQANNGNNVENIVPAEEEADHEESWL